MEHQKLLDHCVEQHALKPDSALARAPKTLERWHDRDHTVVTTHTHEESNASH